MVIPIGFPQGITSILFSTSRDTCFSWINPNNLTSSLKLPVCSERSVNLSLRLICRLPAGILESLTERTPTFSREKSAISGTFKSNCSVSFTRILTLSGIRFHILQYPKARRNKKESMAHHVRIRR